MSAGSKEGGEEAGASLLAGSQHFIGGVFPRFPILICCVAKDVGGLINKS